ncbi:MAG: SET domain-containing protein-lysine N-methyltransferase [Pseudomonadota bacterium]
MALVWFSPKVAKRRSGIEGTGLFAEAPLAPGEIAVVKGGHVFDRAMRDRLEPLLGPAEIQIGDDLFIGPMTPADRDAGMMHLNHSCAPNLGFVGEITFAARRAIEAGEELSLDYATGDDDDWEMDCACGAATCRGRVTGQDWRLPSVRAANAGWFSPYLERRIAAEAAG